MIVYDHALNIAEREAVGTYLGGKYALFAAPSAVSGLSATALNQSQVNLVWTPSNRPDQVVYEVQRKTGAGSFAKIGETTGSGFTDSGLNAGTAYTCRVRMRAMSGTGAYSAEATVSTLSGPRRRYPPRACACG